MTHWGWWVSWNGRALHFLAEIEGDHGLYCEIRDTTGNRSMRAACGLRSRFSPAGILSRMGAPRCSRCCKQLAIPRGTGTPRNAASKMVKP